MNAGGDFTHRRESVRQALSDVDALLVTNPTNVRYLSGFTGSNGAVVLSTSGDVLVTDPRYAERAQRQAPGLETVIVSDLASAAVERTSGQRLGVEAHHLSWARADQLKRAATSHNVEIVPTVGVVETPRRIKDAHELDAIRQACAMTCDALAYTIEAVLRPGVTERQIAVALERAMIDFGASGIAFASIVASGPNGAIPHHEAGDRPIATGEMVTIDCGASFAGYHADCTRTVAVGEPSAQLREIFALVRAAQRAGRAAVAAGCTIGEIDGACRNVIADAGYGDAFVHPTGHGVGLDVHEWPIVAQDVRDSLPAGAVLTVEPGIYLPGVGGVRIEDTLAVHDGSVEVLTDLARDF